MVLIIAMPLADGVRVTGKGADGVRVTGYDWEGKVSLETADVEECLSRFGPSECPLAPEGVVALLDAAFIALV